MIRNLKVLGLALVAVLAMSAVAASGASAQNGELTATEPFTLTGSDHVEGLELHFEKEDEVGVSCHKTHYIAEKFTTEEGQTLIDSGDSTVTVTPTYEDCTFGGFPVTVTLHDKEHECDFDLHIGETTTGDTYDVDSELTCLGNKPVVEVHIYLSHEAHTAKQPFCTITIEPHKKVLQGATVTDEGNGHLTLGGEIEGIEQHKEGACGAAESTTGTLALGATLEGLNSVGKTIPVSISHQ